MQVSVSYQDATPHHCTRHPIGPTWQRHNCGPCPQRRVTVSAQPTPPTSISFAVLSHYPRRARRGSDALNPRAPKPLPFCGRRFRGRRSQRLSGGASAGVVSSRVIPNSISATTAPSCFCDARVRAFVPASPPPMSFPFLLLQANPLRAHTRVFVLAWIG
jgi:hypothetical protein